MGQAEGPFNTNLSEQVYDSYQLPQSNVLQLANAQTYKGDTDTANQTTHGRVAVFAICCRNLASLSTGPFDDFTADEVG